MGIRGAYDLPSPAPEMRRPAALEVFLFGRITIIFGFLTNGL